MTNQQHLSEALRQYRQMGAEIGELRQQLDQKIGTLTASEAQKEFEELKLRTKEFDQLRARLGPTDLFLAKYGVEVVSDHTVSFVVPKGYSRIEILEEANRSANEPGFISSKNFHNWVEDPRFTSRSQRSAKLCIEGKLEGSGGGTRKQQEHLTSELGLQRPNFEDLVIALAAFWVATGKPLPGRCDSPFGGYVVRAASGCATIGIEGLRTSTWAYDLSDDPSFVAAVLRE
jgi:hypothetical protein